MNEVDEGHAFIHDERMEVLAAGVVCACVCAGFFFCLCTYACMYAGMYTYMYAFICMYVGMYAYMVFRLSQ